eukprot:TRINITY_DN12561_c0_g8_i1.p1 TRINITY_DN12561_c0_g8~~TRINITY_DN12561_c0_g8_i1.p1  ORF type:complete len:194 (+),score=28.56 TRINITY_DN12561_c0_g8_i1:36-617(+)
MGNKHSSSGPENIDVLEENTCLTRSEIEEAYRHFNAIAEHFNRTPHKDGTIKVLVKDVKEAIPQLKHNPLGTRIIRVFSYDGKHLEFVDYLEMIAAFSRNADRQLKLDIAFLIYDYDNDGYLDKMDLFRGIRKMAKSKKSDRPMIELVADLALREADLDGDHALSKFEFEQIISKVTNFYDLFQFHVNKLTFE